MHPGTTTLDTNLLVILDTSGSMGDTVSIDGHSMTKLAAAEQAIKNLFNEYDKLGDVALKLVTFSDTGHETATWITSVTQLNSALTSLSASGATNYDAALTSAITAFGTGSIKGAQNVSYFLSDGVPTVSNVSTVNGSITDHNYGDGILPSSQDGLATTGGVDVNGYLHDAASGVTETEWLAFLNSNSIQSFAIGMGSGAVASELNPIAYNSSGTEGIVVTSFSDLSSTLIGTVVIPPTATGNLISNGEVNVLFGADGPGNPKIVSIAHDTNGDGTIIGTGEVYNTLSTGYNHSTNELTITTREGGTLVVNFDTGAYSYTAPQTFTDNMQEVFTYTVQDGDGDTATAHLTVTVDSEPAAYDNFNQAVVHSVSVPDTTTNTTLADFSSSLSFTDMGGGNHTATQIASDAATNLSSWQASTQSGTTSDAIVSGGHLQIVDNNGSTAGAAQLLSPVYTIGSSGSSSLSFDVSRSHTNPADSVTWTLYKNVSGAWVAQTGTGNTGAITADSTVTTGVLTAGAYRIFINANDGSGTQDLTLNLDNFTSHVTTHNPDIVEGVAVSGNVLTDPNTYIASTDLWGAVDSKGAAGATLQIFDGSVFHDASTGYTVHGTYGDLLLHSDGSYTYTPTDPLLTDVGNEDVFTYKLVQPDGDSDTASLVVKIDSSAYSVPTPISGTTGDDNIIGTTGDDVILGKGGNDIIHGGTGQDHIEGGTGNNTLYGEDGNDVLIAGSGDNHLDGGAGNDILVGGAGNDILVGGTGHNTLTGGTGADTFKVGQGDDHITDYKIAEGDKVDISSVLNEADETAARAHLAVVDNGGKAELDIFNDAHAKIGSVTFDTIDSSSLGTDHQLDHLLGQIDLNHKV